MYTSSKMVASGTEWQAACDSCGKEESGIALREYFPAGESEDGMRFRRNDGWGPCPRIDVGDAWICNPCVLRELEERRQLAAESRKCWFCKEGNATPHDVIEPEYGNFVTRILAHDQCFDNKKYLASLSEEDWMNMCE